MKNSIFLLFSLLILAACARPKSEEQFVLRENARDGVYIFDVEMADSSSSYDFWFYSRVNTRPISNLKLRVQWISPDGNSFAEEVYMKEVAQNGTKELYRKDMVPIHLGMWKLSVRPIAVDNDFCGLGLIKVENYGAR